MRKHQANPPCGRFSSIPGKYISKLLRSLSQEKSEKLLQPQVAQGVVKTKCNVLFYFSYNPGREKRHQVGSRKSNKVWIHLIIYQH